MADTKDTSEEALKNLFSGSRNSTARKTVEVSPEITPVARIKVIGVGGGGGNAHTVY